MDTFSDVYRQPLHKRQATQRYIVFRLITQVPERRVGKISAVSSLLEALLNRDSVEGRLVAHYLYEHLYLAHLYFPDIFTHDFFKAVRSASPAGEPTRMMASRPPIDDPSVEHVSWTDCRLWDP